MISFSSLLLSQRTQNWTNNFLPLHSNSCFWTLFHLIFHFLPVAIITMSAAFTLITSSLFSLKRSVLIYVLYNFITIANHVVMFCVVLFWYNPHVFLLTIIITPHPSRRNTNYPHNLGNYRQISLKQSSLKQLSSLKSIHNHWQFDNWQFENNNSSARTSCEFHSHTSISIQYHNPTMPW